MITYFLECKNDIRLQRDDVVFFPQRGKTINVSGEINRPAIYELKTEEKLKDLIRIAGGLVNTTYNERIQINRILPPEQRSKLGMDRKLIDINLDSLMKSKG